MRIRCLYHPLREKIYILGFVDCIKQDILLWHTGFWEVIIFKVGQNNTIIHSTLFIFERSLRGSSHLQ